MVYLSVFIVSLLIFVVILYAIRVVALHKLMSYAGLPNTWLAFIPATEFYIFYKLLDGTIEMGGKLWDAKKTRNVLYRLPYGLFIVTFPLMLFLVTGNALYAVDVLSWVVNIVYMVIWGLIGFNFSRVYLNNNSPVGALIAVISPSIFLIYLLVNIDTYRKSVDQLHNPGIDLDNVDGVVNDEVIELKKEEVSTVDNETLEELFTDVKVDNEVGSGIHLTKVSEVVEKGENISKTEDTVEAEDEEEAKRKLEISKAMFDAEVAALEAEKEFEAYNAEALEADIKALEAEFELSKVEEAERLRVEAERVEDERLEAERIESERVNVNLADSLVIDEDDTEEIELDVDTNNRTVYGDVSGTGKSFSYDEEIDLTNDTDESKSDRESDK